MRADEIAKRDKEDLKPLIKRHKELTVRRDYLIDYWLECQNQKKWEVLPAITEELDPLKIKIKKLGSIISSSQYSIKWLEDAKEPGNRREIGRRSRYQRTIFIENMDYFAHQFIGKSKDELSPEENERLSEALNGLTDREKEALLLVRGCAFSFQTAADYMKVTKGTVQNLVERGESKIERSKEFGFQINLF